MKIDIFQNFPQKTEYLLKFLQYFEHSFNIDVIYSKEKPFFYSGQYYNTLDKALQQIISDYLNDKTCWEIILSKTYSHYWNKFTGDLVYIEHCKGDMCVFKKTKL